MRRFQQTFKILKEWHDLSGNSAKDNAVALQADFQLITNHWKLLDKENFPDAAAPKSQTRTRMALLRERTCLSRSARVSRCE